MPYSHEESRSSHDCTLAVIYARVSSTKQTKIGDGLNSQITRCTEYARHRGYDVVQTFSDDMSGKVLDRPGMKDMLTFLKRYKKATRHVVIIDDISRLARGIETHLALRSSIAEAGGILESPSIEFGEDSDSLLVENLLAVVSQHQRQKNGEQVKHRMRSRVLNGYWPFRAPLGYRFERRSGQGKVLVRHEPMASIIQECFEGFASGRFASQSEVHRYLESLPHFPRDARGLIRFQRIREMFEHPVYAGLVEAKKWQVPVRPGNHEGLVSVETFERVQDRMAKKEVLGKVRKDMHPDFVLRGFVKCADCGHSYTSVWAKGRSKKYPYYHCYNRACSSYGKSIKRAKIEEDVEHVIRSLAPKPSVVETARAMFDTLWQRKHAAFQMHANALRKKLDDYELQVSSLLDRLASTDNAQLVSVYEKKIADLEIAKVSVREKLGKQGQPARTLPESFRTAIEFLLNPIKPYACGDVRQKRLVLKLAFGAPIIYSRDDGVRTAKPSMPFQVLQGLTGKNGCSENCDLEMVRPRGLEPPRDLTPTATSTLRVYQFRHGRMP